MSTLQRHSAPFNLCLDLPTSLAHTFLLRHQAFYEPAAENRREGVSNDNLVARVGHELDTSVTLENLDS